MRSDLNPADSPHASAQHFHTWLVASQNQTLPPTVPTLVNLGRTLWDGPDTHSLPAKIRRDFGSLLRFPPTPRRLAAIATYNLARRFRLELRPSAPSYHYHDTSYPSSFMAAHLRTEPDAQRAGWLSSTVTHANFSAQTDAYLTQAVQAGLDVIYVATGDERELERFRHKAWEVARVNVTGKRELLGQSLTTGGGGGGDAGGSSDEGREDDPSLQLEALSWDQRALVDWEVLMRAGAFGGFVKSSFAYNIAVSRAAVGEREERVVEERWWEVQPEELDGRDQMAWRDRWSTVWGRDEWHERKIPRGAWP